MSRKYLAIGLFIVAVTLLAAGFTRPSAEAAGTITGDLPPNGGIALILCSGGPSSEIIEATEIRDCALDSIWSLVGGFPIGYLIGAPDFVNERYRDVYPNGEVPAGPLLLVCQPIIVLQPGDHSPAIVSTQPTGITFVFNTGVYRNVAISPRAGDTFRGEPGAILSGAKVLQGFEGDGSVWSIGGQNSQLQAHGWLLTPRAAVHRR
jgi:hypothetical protein